MAFLVILSRWTHIVTACLAVGGSLFIRFVLPRGLAAIDESARKDVHLVLRRTWKMVIHTCILLFLLSGTFNSAMAWNQYELGGPLLHALWGTHVALALFAFTVALYMLAGVQPRPRHKMLLTLTVTLLLLTVASASALKWARDKSVADRAKAAVISVSVHD